MTGTLKLKPGRTIHRIVDGETMILDLDSDEYIRGNGSLTLVWPLLVRGCELAELAASFEAHFDVEPAEALDAAEALRGDLRGRGWID